jgi:3',5'-cyclic AMP phosphodiesterase CpdA
VIVHGPYLQAVTTASIVVAWETDLPAIGQVVYGETTAYGQVAGETVAGTHHAVPLTGLAPYTRYHYRVEAGGAPLSADAAFRSAAPPGQPFTLVVFGDTRSDHRTHQAVVDHILTLAPDVALHTGDLVNNGWEPRDWNKFFEIEGPLLASVPLFPVLGNHEGSSMFYYEDFYLPGNEQWYTFDYGDARFVCLKVDGETDYGPGSEQYAWLEETLAANTQPWLFVAFHSPPHTAVEERAGESATVREALAPILEQYGVDVVFSGHSHTCERYLVNGITYIVAGGGGAPLYQTDEQEEPGLIVADSAYHAVRITIDGSSLTAVTTTPDGEELDRFTLP